MFSPDLGNRIIIFFLINIVATSFDIIITSSRVVPLLKVLEKKKTSLFKYGGFFMLLLAYKK